MKDRFYVFSTLCLCSLTSAFAFAEDVPTQRPYDYDLFSKDRETVTGEVELLYWNILEGDLQYASRMKQPTTLSSVGALGEYEKINLGWAPGFRVRLDYYNAPKYWNVMAQYTWFETNGNQTSTAPSEPNQYLQPFDDTGLTLSTSDPMQEMKASINFRFNVADALVDRVFFPNAHLRMKVLGGLTSTWMDQHFTVRSTQKSGLKAENLYKWGYWGLGFRFGFNVDWYWGNNIYFTGRTSAAVLVGKYKNRTQTTYQSVGSTTLNNTFASSYYKDFRGAYNVEFILGPSWQKSYPNKRYEVFFGYEFNTWFNLDEVWRFQGTDPSKSIGRDINNSPVSLNGFNLRLTVDF